ncbi:MAG: RNA pseudouridine synthase [Phycisphaerae bacterium]|nr:RNA pseudouridine synthase [Phycisphaerae bacterium]
MKRNNGTITIEPNERVTFGMRYESDELIVVDKPAGVVTQPGVGHEHDTLLNGLWASYEKQLRQLGASRDWGLVHRLDRQTSGLVAVALSQRMYDAMRAAFAERRVRKHYWAVCLKRPEQPDGVIRRPIFEQVKRKDKYTSEKKAILSAEGKPAITAYRTLQASDTAALIEARPVTGRLHQVRVHLASIGAGILGDQVYGPRRTSGAAARVALHAWRLVLPVGADEEIDVRSPMPRDMRRLLRLHDLEPPSASKRVPSEHGGDEVARDPVGEEDAAVGEDPT